MESLITYFWRQPKLLLKRLLSQFIGLEGSFVYLFLFKEQGKPAQKQKPTRQAAQ